MLAHTLEILIDFGKVLVPVLAKCLSEALVKNAHQFSGRINSRAKCFARDKEVFGARDATSVLLKRSLGVMTIVEKIVKSVY